MNHPTEKTEEATKTENGGQREEETPASDRQKLIGGLRLEFGGIFG